MAITRDATSSVNAATPLTLAHTCTGSNRILFVQARGETTDNVTGVTYNAVSMSLVGKIHPGSGGSYIYLFVLANPASGTNNIVLSTTGGENVVCLGTSYAGAKQTGQPDASATNSVSSSFTTITTSVTTIADNCWTIIAMGDDNGGLTAGTGATLVNAGVNTGVRSFDSNASITPAGSYSMTITGTGGGGYTGMAAVMASFSPFVAAVVNSSFFNFM